MRRAMLIIGHGSRSQAAADSFFQVVDLVREKSDFFSVDGAFMELAQPSIPDTLAKVAARGVSEIVIVPFFLYAGIHIQEDIPGIIAELAPLYPEVKMKMAQPIGVDPAVAEILLARALAVE